MNGQGMLVSEPFLKRASRAVGQVEEAIDGGRRGLQRPMDEATASELPLTWRVMCQVKPASNPVSYQWVVVDEINTEVYPLAAGMFIPVMRAPVFVRAPAWTDVAGSSYSLYPVYAVFRLSEAGEMTFYQFRIVTDQPVTSFPAIVAESSPGVYEYRILLGALSKDVGGVISARQYHFGPIHEAMFPAFFNVKATT
jgi:hypothetical protein